MRPFIKWAGGKEAELEIIRENMPGNIERYIEPFVGGGAVCLDLENENSCINDLSEELIGLYRAIANQDQVFFDTIQGIYNDFRRIDNLIDNNRQEILDLYLEREDIEEFIRHKRVMLGRIGRVNREIFLRELRRNLHSKIRRSARLEATAAIGDEDRIKNIESAIKSAYYMTIRTLYNQTETTAADHIAYFYFVREYCYSSMFRYNGRGEFNVPYGGISYNRKDFQSKIDYLRQEETAAFMGAISIFNMDFEEFLDQVQPGENDFIFLDPPYDSDFSTYCMNEFNQEAQIRLRDCMLRTEARFMLVIKETPFIRELYERDFNISYFEKNYMVSFKNRNDRQVNHLIITNY